MRSISVHLYSFIRRNKLKWRPALNWVNPHSAALTRLIKLPTITTVLLQMRHRSWRRTSSAALTTDKSHRAMARSPKWKSFVKLRRVCLPVSELHKMILTIKREQFRMLRITYNSRRLYPNLNLFTTREGPLEWSIARLTLGLGRILTKTSVKMTVHTCIKARGRPLAPYLIPKEAWAHYSIHSRQQ